MDGPCSLSKGVCVCVLGGRGEGDLVWLELAWTRSQKAREW